MNKLIATCILVSASSTAFAGTYCNVWVNRVGEAPMVRRLDSGPIAYPTQESIYRDRNGVAYASIRAGRSAYQDLVIEASALLEGATSSMMVPPNAPGELRLNTATASILVSCGYRY